MRQAYNHKSFQQSVASGDWGRMISAPNKASPVAETIRAALGISHVPDAPNECKAVRRYEKRQKQAAAAIPTFDNPFAQKDVKRIAALAAGAGLVQGSVNDAGEKSLFLTEIGLATARGVSRISEDATPQQVVAALFTHAPEASLEPSAEPSSSPELIELVAPASESATAVDG